MLSRTADNLYWLARYVERAEYLARILEVTQRLTTLPLAYVGTTNEWESAVATAGCAHAFSAIYPEANEETVIDFLCFSTANPVVHPILALEVARTNAARGAHGAHGRDVDAINGTWLELIALRHGPTSREEFMRFLRWCRNPRCASTARPIGRCSANDAYWFSRPASTWSAPTTPARILDVKYHLCCPQRAASGPARLIPVGPRCCARSRTHRLSLGVPRERQAVAVADLLILKDEMRARLPAATRIWCRTSTTSRAPMAARGPAQRQARAVRTRIQNSRMEEIFQQGLHEFIEEFIDSNNKSAPPFTEQYLM